MAKKQVHEEHVNHEAWAIPYGDLVTLLLAFFVVMYAMSSINEGKYRVAAASISAAFGSTPRTLTPVQVGKRQAQGSNYDRPAVGEAGERDPRQTAGALARVQNASFNEHSARESILQLHEIGERLRAALDGLVETGEIAVRSEALYLEIEIRSDILFASGSAQLMPQAESVVRAIAGILREEDNPMRVEGHTDNMPIASAAFPSNWELSAARAASVVRLMNTEGVEAPRLAVLGYGEQQPVGDNATAEGRNANRRVLLVILAGNGGQDAFDHHKLIQQRSAQNLAPDLGSQAGPAIAPMAPAIQLPMGSGAAP